MKKIILFVLFGLIFGCKQQDKDRTIKKDLSEILDAIKTENTEKLYSYLLSQNVVDELLINADEKRKEAVSVYSMHLQKNPKDIFTTLKDNKHDNWEAAKPCMLSIFDGYGGYGNIYLKKVELIFAFNSEFEDKYYQLEFYIYNHKGKNYYIIKSGLDEINTKGQCDDIYNEIKEDILEFKRKDPNKYEMMKPELIKY
jgi:hypothetical protein